MMPYQKTGSPYPPPMPTMPPPAQPYALYDATAVRVASFIGGPFAGSILMALNCKKTGAIQAAWKVTGVGALVTLVLVILASLLPIPQGGSYFIPAVVTVGMGQWATQQQGSMVTAHLQAGGNRGSVWAGAGIGLITALPVIAILLAGGLSG